MLPFFVSILSGVFLGIQKNFLFILIIFLVSSLLILLNFRKINGFIVFLLFVFVISSINTYIRTLEVYKDNENISGVFTVKEVDNNYYVLKKGLLKFNGYMKEDFKVGDLIEIIGNIEYFPQNMNEYGFNLWNVKKSQGIDYKINIKKVNFISEGRFYYKIRNKFNSYVKKIFDKYLYSKNSSIMKSVILADKSYMNINTVNNFNITGLSHVLAVSGLHISIIMIFFDLLLYLFNFGKILRRSISIIITGLYILIINFPPGAVRAYIMTVSLFICFISKRKYSSLNFLLLSACICILLNPFAVYSLSFIYSYTAVLSIILFLKFFENHLPGNYLGRAVALCLAVNVLIFPISMYYFYEFSLLTFLSNVFAVPLFSLTVGLSFFILLFPYSGFIIGPFLNLLLDFILNTVNYLSTFKFMVLSLNTFTLWDVIIYYLCIYILFNWNNIGFLYYIKNIILYSLVLISLFVLFFFYDDILIADFIYVDQGDCSVISYKGKCFMIDTGGSSSKNYRPGYIYTLNYLRRHGISEIEGLFISHFDMDHFSGITDIEKYNDINNIYISYLESNEILEYFIKNKKNVYLLKKDDMLTVDENLSFMVLSDSGIYSNANDKSMVLELKYRDKSILYTGDISKDVESDIYGEFDVLKVAHHGSKFSTGIDFLKKISPEYAIISSGINNRYNHPNSEVINRLDKFNIKTYITSVSGQIRVVFGDNIKVLTLEEFENNNDYIYVNIIAGTIFYLIIYRMREKWNIKKFTNQI